MLKIGPGVLIAIIVRIIILDVMQCSLVVR
jgi:hypothetical protein